MPVRRQATAGDDASLQAVAHGSDTVQYFQWRKSRGSSEKFHGAVVDHVGHENTRVFRDVTERAEREEATRRLAYRDELTGLANRRAFFQRGSRMLRKSGLADQPISLQATDIYNPLVTNWQKNGVFEACTECWVNMSEATGSALSPSRGSHRNW